MSFYGIKNVGNRKINLNKEVIVEAKDLLEAYEKFKKIYNLNDSHIISIFELNFYED